MNFIWIIGGWGIQIGIWDHNFDIMARTVLGVNILVRHEVWRGERVLWLNECRTVSLEWERIKRGHRVDGWRIRGPLERTV